jgi:hypothetical protein
MLLTVKHAIKAINILREKLTVITNRDRIKISIGLVSRRKRLLALIFLKKDDLISLVSSFLINITNQ